MRKHERLVSLAALAFLHAFAAAQSDFPRISQVTQQERDSDRRLILQAELRDEQAALTTALALYRRTPGQEQLDAVHRHEENIKALHRELGDKGPSISARTTDLIASQRLATSKPEARSSQSGQAERDRAVVRPASRSGTGWVIFTDAKQPVLPLTPAASPYREPARAHVSGGDAHAAPGAVETAATHQALPGSTQPGQEGEFSFVQIVN